MRYLLRLLKHKLGTRAGGCFLLGNLAYFVCLNLFSLSHPYDSKRDSSVRVLCWVLTTRNAMNRAEVIKSTWGRRCDKLIFISSTKEDSLPTVAVPVNDTYDALWGKTQEALKYIYQNHFDDAEWFYKADDDTYAVMENLKHLLVPLDPWQPVQLGYHYRYHPDVIKTYGRSTGKSFITGGPGYVLSKEALRRFVTIKPIVPRPKQGIESDFLCFDGHDGPEDLFLGNCLEKVNVAAGDTRDTKGRERFIPHSLEEHLGNTTGTELQDWAYFPLKEDLECCSPSAAAFHKVKEHQIYEYLIYKLQLAS